MRRTCVLLFLLFLTGGLAAFAQADSSAVQTGSASESQMTSVQTGSTTAESPSSPVQTDSASIAAVVNGEVITRDELALAAGTSNIIQTLYGQFPRFVQALLGTSEGLAFLDVYEREILDQLIDSRLLVQQAILEAVTVDEAALDTRVAEQLQLIQVQNGITEEDMERILAQQGSSLDEYRERLRASYRDQALVDALHTKITELASVSDSEIAVYYAGHQDEFKSSEGTVRPLEEVADEIRSTLLSEAQGAAWTAWFSQKKAEASIEVLLK